MAKDVLMDSWCVGGGANFAKLRNRFREAALVFDNTGNTPHRLGAGELAKSGKLRQCFRPRVV